MTSNVWLVLEHRLFGPLYGNKLYKCFYLYRTRPVYFTSQTEFALILRYIYYYCHYDTTNALIPSMYIEVGKPDNALHFSDMKQLSRLHT